MLQGVFLEAPVTSGPEMLVAYSGSPGGPKACRYYPVIPCMFNLAEM